MAVIDSGVANAAGAEAAASSRAWTSRTTAGRGIDHHGHGTHVAGIIAAAGANAHDDTRGVAPGAHIVSLKVLDARGPRQGGRRHRGHRLGD